jgi:hypothetical protein
MSEIYARKKETIMSEQEERKKLFNEVLVILHNSERDKYFVEFWSLYKSYSNSSHFTIEWVDEVTNITVGSGSQVKTDLKALIGAFTKYESYLPDEYKHKGLELIFKLIERDIDRQGTISSLLPSLIQAPGLLHELYRREIADFTEE